MVLKLNNLSSSILNSPLKEEYKDANKDLDDKILNSIDKLAARSVDFNRLTKIVKNAYATIEKVEAENKKLKEEIAQLKAQLGK